ncbi:tetratricopeptide repeat protein, partial [Bordetella bronchiseptica]
ASYEAPAARMEPPSVPAGAFIVQDKPARAGAANANAVAAMAEAFDRAAAAGDLGTARRQLDSLRAALPGESLTLLRRQAWLHMYGGNDRAAAESYRALLARLPNDENAGLNLAIIEARQGRVADARALLERLRQQHPDSRGVRALQEQIGHEQR